jgi:guanylate cyclase
MAVIRRVGAEAGDSEEARLQKTLLVGASLMFILAGLLWGSIYVAFNEPLAGAVPISYALFSSLSILLFGLTHRYRLYRFSQLLLILLLPFLLQLALGGFVNSSAAILKDKDETIAEHYDSVSILFADIVGFTALSDELSPTEMVDLLNEVFSRFDALVTKYNLEKIRTIGDNYMVVSGAPRPRPDHAQALACLALEMRAYIEEYQRIDRRLSFRIGIGSGPVVGGVIGRQKFHYDVWGDAVNMASRMESQGVPGKIQITRDTYELLKDACICLPRGKVSVKGKGEMETWFLEGIKS